MTSIIYFGIGRWRVGAMGVDTFHMPRWVLNGCLFRPFHFLLTMKHATTTRWLANPNRAVEIFLVIFGVHMNILFLEFIIIVDYY